MMEFYTSQELEKIFKISPVTLQRWRKNNLIPFIQVTSKKFLYSKGAIEDFFNHHASQQGTSHQKCQ